MKNLSSKINPVALKRIAVATLALSSAGAYADTVTDWNYFSTLALKAATSTTTGTASLAQNSNVSTRIEAIEARAVFDAVNAINHFSPSSYYYVAATPSGTTANSAAAAAAQAAHDVLVGALPSSLASTKTWLDGQLASSLAALGVSAIDPGIAAGKAAAAAALAARASDGSAIRTTYIPSTNISASGTATDAGNPGIGFWRPTNSAAGAIDPTTGAPTGFSSAGAIQPQAAIDFNWKNVTPFSLTTLKKQQLVAAVPPAARVGGAEYLAEVAFVQSHGQEASAPTQRSNDQTLQALYYKQDAELFINEAARIGSQLRGYTLNQNAKLFAALDSALADARIAAWQSKYDLALWRPITAINADSTGNVTSYTWKPLAATPSHPSGTAGHSTTIAAGAQILRSFFGSDSIDPSGNPVTLTTPSWIIGTNNGTGKLSSSINGADGTTRTVSSLSQLQLENGQSRLFLGVHFGNDNYQGQTLGLAVADAIINTHADPAVAGVANFIGGANVASTPHLYTILTSDSANSGFFGL